MAEDAVQTILKAMVANATAAHAKATLEQQKVRDIEEQRQNKANESLRTDALKQAGDIAERNHEHQIAQEDIAHEANKLQAKSAHLAAVQQMFDRVSKGTQNLDPTQQDINLPDLGINIPQGSQMVDGEAIPAGQFETLPQKLQRLEQEGRAKIKGPEELATQRANDQMTREETIHTLDRTSQEKVGAAHDAASILRARIAAAAAGVRHGVDPDLIQSLGEAASVGQADLTGTTPASLAARKYLEDTGQKPFLKKNSDALKSTAAINSFFDDIKAFANKNLSDSQLGAFASGAIQKATPWPTEAKNDLDILKQNAINVGKSIEGISGGRVTNRQLDLMINGMASVGKTKSQVIKDADALKAKFLTGVNSTILGGFSPSQRSKILETHGLSESGIGGTTSTPKELDEDTARKILVQSGGDKDKARAAAKAMGYEVK